MIPGQAGLQVKFERYVNVDQEIKMTRAEKFWDKMANRYDREELDSEPVTMKIIEKTNKYLKPSDEILDFGCGTGLVCNEIAGNVKTIRALDISSNMIEIAKRKADERNIENIEYLKGTIFDDRYESGSLDAILAFYILHILDDTPGVIQRCYDLLKPGGYLISATPCMGAKPLQWLLLSLASIFGLVPGIRFFKAAQLEKVISRGKFEIIETECLDSRSGEQYIAARKMESS